MIWERADFGKLRTPIPWFHPNASTHVALVDGSCDTIEMGELVSYIARNNAADLVPSRNCACDTEGSFFHSTYRGVAGRDLPR